MLFSSDWLFEIAQEKQNAINQFLNDYQDISIDMFEIFGNYGLVHPMDSLLELYKLPDIKDYDVLIFQTNSNFYKDYRQQMIDEAHKYHIPVVSINDPIKDCVYVGTDNQQAIYKLTQTISAERNCQKVAYVSGPMSSREARLRKAGFLQATKDLEDIQIIEGASCGYPTNEKDDFELKKEYLSYTYHSNCFFESTERLETLLSQTSHFYDLFDVFEKESQNFGYKQIYLVMNSKYIDEMSENIIHFSDKMYLMGMTYHKNSPDEKHIYQEFSKKEVLPQEYKSRYMIYTYLSNNGVAIGYLAFDNYSKNISINYMTIILKLLGLTIESMRKKHVLSLLNKELENLYVKDSLTHLYNRFGMNQLGKSLYYQLIEKDQQALIYFIDMDFMKKTNDLYGHDMGDSAIKEIASIILKVISKEDIAIRYGGDEFVIITNYSSKDLSTKITDEVFSFLNTHIPQVIIKIRNDSLNFFGFYV